jgi:hypothetical protein
VSVVTGGAAGLLDTLSYIQETLDNTPAAAAADGTGTAAAAAAAAAVGPPPVVIEWVAPWATTSLTASQQLRALAASCCQLPVITLDVTVSDINRAMALEKVMEVPQVYRKGGRKFLPVPKSGGRICWC